MKALARGPWLFGARLDLGVFLGSAVASLLLLWVGHVAGVLHDDTPDWAWIPAVLLIDVAHVWSTIYRVYLDRDERSRRPWLYYGIPGAAWAVAFFAYATSPFWFWRGLAYVAVFHFVRQQYGWVALYRGRAGETSRFDTALDTAAIYAASGFPLLHWHAHLPQSFWWFLPGDFAAVPDLVATVAEPVYWLVMLAYLARALQRWLVLRTANPGKDVVVVTTAICWYVGIVVFASDYAFTVTNVIIHGVPYFALIYWVGRRRANAGHGGGIRLLRFGPALFLGSLFALAFLEEAIWDRAMWHERDWLFGAGWQLGVTAEALVVATLVVPQLTHYVLDGFIWRRRYNPHIGLGRAGVDF